MRSSVILLFIILSTSAWAKNNALMKCLGQEELKLHKLKKDSPLYRLNQDVISAMLQLHEKAVLKPKLIKEVCSESAYSASYELLKVIIFYKKDSFINLEKKNSMLHGVAKKSIDDLYLKITDVFISYIAGLRANAPTKDCIEKNVPALTPLYERMLYLQEHWDREKILDSVKNLHEIFFKLEFVDKIYEKCSKK